MRSVGIFPALSHIDNNAGQIRCMDFNFGDFPPVEVFPDRNRYKAAAALYLAQYAATIEIPYRYQLPQRVESLIYIAGPFRDQDNPIIFAIARQRQSRAIENAASGRRQQTHIDAVLLSQ